MFKKVVSLGGIILLAQIGLNNSFANTGSDTAVSVIDSFEKKFGITKGKRRNHTKGFCFEATLSPYKDALQPYSKSVLFSEESTVTGRLSHKGGNNLASDNKHADYGMGLSINPSSGGTQLMSMNTLDFSQFLPQKRLQY